MSCGCGKQRAQNVGRLWAHIDALEILQAEALEENERLREALEVVQGDVSFFALGDKTQKQVDAVLEEE